MFENFFDKLGLSSGGEEDENKKRKNLQSFPGDNSGQENLKPNDPFPSNYSNIKNSGKDENSEDAEEKPATVEEANDISNKFLSEMVLAGSKDLDALRLDYEYHSDYKAQIDELERILKDNLDNLQEQDVEIAYRSLFTAKKKYMDFVLVKVNDSDSLFIAKRAYVKYKDVYSEEESEKINKKFSNLTEEFMNDVSSDEQNELNDLEGLDDRLKD